MKTNFPRPGAFIEAANRVRFSVWAPEKQRLEVVLDHDGRSFPMEASSGGFFEAVVQDVGPGAHYRIRVDGSDFPDPASRFQPDGVHGPSEVIDPDRYAWTDADWAGIPLDQAVIYELHVGTFTPEGTYDGVRKRLPFLRDLGINAIELMPLADFPGRWNWGYDPGSFYAPSRNYGRPDDLRRLVDEAHQMGIAVILDVIYNHFGPDGAYAPAFGPFFTSKHETPWGKAVNLDDEHSDGVRHFFIDNALYWLRDFHFDGLRLDATHALIDDSPKHFLTELAERVEALDTRFRRYLIAEDHRNLDAVITPLAEDGLGMDAVWADDFHHLLRHRTAGDSEGYYAAFVDTTPEDIALTINKGWHYRGQTAPNTGEPRGTDPEGIPPHRFIYFIQNHDQVGNRPLGNRLTDDIPLHTYRALSALLLFLPQTPMLFMGQEWAATTPFLFFTDHNEELGHAVTAGRRVEFSDFKGFSGTVPDPQDPSTFEQSRLLWEEISESPHREMLTMYRDLLERRRGLRGHVLAEALSDDLLKVERGADLLMVCFGSNVSADVPDGFRMIWHSEQSEYVGDMPEPPQVDESRLRFIRPTAVIFRRQIS